MRSTVYLAMFIAMVTAGNVRAQTQPTIVYISGSIPGLGGSCVSSTPVFVDRPALVEANGVSVQAMGTLESRTCGEYSFGHFSGATPPGGSSQGPIQYVVHYSNQILAPGFSLQGVPGVGDERARVLKTAPGPPCANYLGIDTVSVTYTVNGPDSVTETVTITGPDAGTSTYTISRAGIGTNPPANDSFTEPAVHYGSCSATIVSDQAARLTAGALYHRGAINYVNIVDSSGNPANTEIYDVSGTLTVSVDANNNVVSVTSSTPVCNISSGIPATCPGS